MTLPSLRAVMAAALVLPLGVAGVSQAQPLATPLAPMERGAWRHPQIDSAQRQAAMAARLGAMLQLQPSQEPALQAYLAALRPPPGMRERIEAERQPNARLTAPERMDRMIARFDEMRARLAARAEATRAFYAQLTPGQQRAFDALEPLLRRMRHRGMDHGMDRRPADAPRGGYPTHPPG